MRAYLPNPGRLWELLFPGVCLYLSPLPPSPDRKLHHVAVAVERDGLPVMLHTHHTNLVAKHLIETDRIPGLEGAEIVQPEFRVGHSRFDFLLRKDGRDILLEVKSCTLFHDTLAMFPDAVSVRATKHLLELKDLTRKGYGAAVLFVVHSPRARWFMPEHHTDLEFCRTLLRVRDRVMVKAISAEWAQDLSLRETSRVLAIPWDLVEREAHDQGSYIVVLQLKRDQKIEAGGLGTVKFKKGYYLYVGSAMKDLEKRLARHRRLTKRKHWHIDFLREKAEFVAGIPIRSSVDRECELASALGSIADRSVPLFGSSDCSCPTHLFAMDRDPFLPRSFSDLLLSFRMGRLEEELARRAVTPR
jgi:sugar fermentation stimulation protein A